MTGTLQLGTAQPERLPDGLSALAARERNQPIGSLPLWPLFALLVLYPVWWALGLTAFVFILLAVPMALALARRRPLRLPPGFALWALFLAWVAAGVLVVNTDVPGTLPVGGAGRYLSYGLRLGNYLAVTVVLLYAGNLTERELPRARLIRWLGALFCVTVLGGVVGTLFPTLSFTSPVAGLMPATLRDNEFVGRLVTPSVAQVQEVLGYSSPRPSAPFEYTNAWGNNFSLLLLWFAVGWLVTATPRRRMAAVLILVVSVVPVVYSLNRGLWAGLGLSTLYVAARLAARGRLGALAGVAVAVAVVGTLVVASPLGTLVSERLATPHSNTVRESLSQASFEGALRSPIIGWGSSRATVGSERSLAIGKTADCPQCGNRVIGSQGQLWQILFAHGFVGAALYIGFFAQAIWRYRRDHSVIGIAGGLGITLPLFYMLIYSALTSPLCVYLLSMALLWRNDLVRCGVDEPQPARRRRRPVPAPVLVERRIEPAPAVPVRPRAEVSRPLASSTPPLGSAEYIRHVAQLLWPLPSRVGLGPGPPKAPQKAAAAGSHRAWVCIPTAEQPRLLVPAGAPRAAATVVLRYAEPRSPRARARGIALAAAFRSGVAEQVFSGRLVVDTGGTGDGLEERLGQALGVRCRFGLHVGPPRANRKPVLTLVTETGRLVGYAKLGVDDLTRALVRAEHAALTTLADADLGRVKVARVLHHQTWEGVDVLVQSPLPVWRRRGRDSTLGRAAAMLSVALFDGTTRAPLATSPLWRRTMSDLERMRTPSAGALRDLAERLVAAPGRNLMLGAWHGDWNPGNVAVLADDVLVWDWERFATGVPVGWDALHYALQREISVRGTPPRTAARDLLAASPALLAPFAQADARRVAAAYLVHLGARYLSDDQSAAGGDLARLDDWLLPALAEVVDDLR